MVLSRLVGAVRKRIPAHARDRLEDLLLPRRGFEQMPAPVRSALTVICDDGEVADLDVVRALDKHGFKGVFAVSPDLIGRPGFLGYSDLRAMHAAGHEIAFHGATHDGFTRFAGPADLSASVKAGLAHLEAQGLSGSRTLVYPYGLNNRWVRAAVEPFFDVAFTTWYGLNQASVNRYAVRRVAFGAYTGKQPAGEAWYRRLIDDARHRACWLALMLHPAAAGHTAAHTEMLERLVGYALERGLPVRTAGEHLRAAPSGAGPAFAAKALP